MDLKLDAARDITLYSAQNIKNTVRHNSSEGGHIGVGIGAGSGGYGISVSAGVNVDQGHEKNARAAFNIRYIVMTAHLER
ncbi:hypothetical protein SODG_004846 [Sodalis praecaptivus]